MRNDQIAAAFAELSTPLVFDACLKLDITTRATYAGLRPVLPSMRVAGRTWPARHFGSVDVFLEAMETCEPGDVLVIDNGGRTDEGCIGDLTALEARAAGMAGLVVWGAHRDTSELERIGVPVFSYGACPMGPRRLDQREPDALLSAHFERFTVTSQSFVCADSDGAVFAPLSEAEALFATALEIQKVERKQAIAIKNGTTLRDQLAFGDFLARREDEPELTFRAWLREVGGAIEE